MNSNNDHNKEDSSDGPVDGKSAFREFINQLKDAEYQRKFLHSVWIAVALFTLGATESQAGPTFLDLQIITHTHVEAASMFFTCHSCGYLCGSLVSGFISKKLNRSLLIFVAMISMGSLTIAMPYCSIYGLMLAVKFVSGIFGGVVDTTANSEHMRVWGNDGQIMMQLLHFFFAMGGIISPLFTEPFLASKEVNEAITTDISNVTTFQELGEGHSSQMATIPSLQSNSSYGNATVGSLSALEEETRRTTEVHWAFLITGIIMCTGAVPFFCMFLKVKTQSDRAHSNLQGQNKYRKLPTSLYLLLIAFLCAFYILYTCVEDSFAAFLMTFVVREFSSVSKSRGAYITAIFWASFAASRFLMIFISRLLNSVRLICLCGVMMLISFSCFTVSSAYDSVAAVTVFAGLAGLSMSAVFPAGMTWSQSELVSVTTRVSSCIFVSASIGSMLNPLLLAFLIDEISNMWFCYLLLIEAAATYVLFLFLLLFNRYYVNAKYGPLHSTTEKKVVPSQTVDEARYSFIQEKDTLEIR